ncbi:hypothetical protein GTY41_02445 [Streptomyces sp. SID685]|uniref:hypothetical protein n=1 Tax=Streptomyces sp. SID685 TaxID=2690322 RepID=UPI001367AD54|nr:hypothetical protein [Streptomyces sp. SID685]MYR83834.1 hypothetical protein [Streptomyces sp. SID685]
MQLTPTQAKVRADQILAMLRPTVSQWTTAVLDQAVLHFADSGAPFGMNDIRLLVPEDDCRKAGVYFAALTGHDALHPDMPQLLRKVGEEPSINPKAHGKKVNVYVLTRAGREFIKDRQDARAQQQRRAA